MSKNADPAVELRADTLRALAQVCLKNSEYDFVHGDQGESFFDADELAGSAWSDSLGERASESIEDLVATLAARIEREAKKQHVSALVFLERDTGPVGAISTRALLAQRCNLPAIIVRPDKRLHGSRIKGSLNRGDSVILIVDVVTSGQTVEEGAQTIWQRGAKVVKAFAFMDNERGGRERLERLDIELEALSCVSDLQALKEA